MGERDGALAALGRAVDAAVSAVSASRPDLSSSLLWDRVVDRLDPARSGTAWAEHKARQADELSEVMRQALAAQVASPEWREFAGDDPRYLEVAAAAGRLSGEGAAGREG